MKPQQITPSGSQFRNLASNLTVVAVIGMTAIGLAGLRVVAPRPTEATETSDPPGAGVIVRYEVVHLWLPETLVERARHGFPAPVARTHQELRTALERRGQENLWYAITIRGHQANRGMADITFIRQPYREPGNFQEFLDVLATVAGSSPRDPAADFSTAIVHVMPVGMSQFAWLEALQATLPLRHGVSPELEANR